MTMVLRTNSLVMTLMTLTLALQQLTTGSATTLQRIATSGSCLDGSPYNFYISEGLEHTKFFIYHQGGSWCFTQDECVTRGSDKTASSLGSSVGWPLQRSMTDGMDRNPTNNPLMYNWTFVYMPYCDGGSFTGNATGSSGNTSLHYFGLKNRQTTVQELTTSFGYDRATDVVVGGGSAGGIACYLHVDFYAAMAPQAKTVAMCDSGFFEDGNNDRDGKGDYDTNMQRLYGYMNSVAGIYSTECTAAMGYKCMFAQHLAPFIKSPKMALNSAYDATMGNGECGAGSGIILNWTDPTSVNECGNHVRAQFKALFKPPNDCVFLDSCKHHCGEWNQITIDGLKCSQAQALWYHGGSAALPNNGYLDANKPFPCTTCCNDKVTL